MNIINSLLLSSIAGLSTIFGSLIIFLKIKPSKYNKFICFCLAFSLSIMISISIFDLIPTYFINNIFFKGFPKTISTIIIVLLCSFIIIKIIEKLTDNLSESKELYKLGLLNMFILVLHNLPEGIATFMSSYNNLNLGIKLTIAIALHNIPEGISIAVPIYYSTGSKLKAFKATLLSGLSEPLGAILAYLFLKKFITTNLVNFILLIVAGLMITLSIQEMLPKAIKYKEKRYLLFGLILGIILVIINLFLFK